jgi:hypothetical protein
VNNSKKGKGKRNYNLQFLFPFPVICIKQTTGIEPASSAWEADILPMYYVCMDRLKLLYINGKRLQDSFFCFKINKNKSKTTAGRKRT